jgi:LemA protein
VLQENYPDLKSNTNFLALQSQLEGTENRIAIARRDYNQTAQTYNTSLRTFPTILWAKTFYGGQKPANLFSASAQAQTAPTVSFEPTTTPPAPSGPPAPSAASAPPAAPK